MNDVSSLLIDRNFAYDLGILGYTKVNQYTWQGISRQFNSKLLAIINNNRFKLKGKI